MFLGVLSNHVVTAMVVEYRYDELSELRCCPAKDDFIMKVIRSMSHGSQEIQQKVDSLRRAMGEIHGTAHIRQGTLFTTARLILHFGICFCFRIPFGQDS